MSKLTGGAWPGPKRRKKVAPPAELRLIPIPFADEILPGDSLAEKLLKSLRRHRLRPGDIVVVKHKIVSKSEGRLVHLAAIQPSAESIAWAKQYSLDARVIELALRESRSVIRRKNGVLITETHHGFLCANSGVDVSNVSGGEQALLLPEDPDRSAANLRRELKKRTGLAIPVIITDSFGRPWREGLTEFAIGIAGTLGEHPPGRLRLGKARKFLRSEVFEIEQPADLPTGRLADDERVRRGQCLQPGGEVRGLADDPALLGSALTEQIADDGEPCGDAKPYAQALSCGQLAHRFDDR